MDLNSSASFNFATGSLSTFATAAAPVPDSASSFGRSKKKGNSSPSGGRLSRQGHRQSLPATRSSSPKITRQGCRPSLPVVSESEGRRQSVPAQRSRHLLTQTSALRLADDLPAAERWCEAKKGWRFHNDAPEWLYKPEEGIYFHKTTESLWKRVEGFGMLRVRDGYARVMGILATFFDFSLLRTSFYVWVKALQLWKETDIASEQRSEFSMPNSRFAVLHRAISDELRPERKATLRGISLESELDLGAILHQGSSSSMPHSPSSPKGCTTPMMGFANPKIAAKCGITYEQLLEFDDLVRSHYGEAYEKVNLHQIVKDIIQPICTQNRMSYARWKNCGTLRPDALVTHCWAEPFSTFVASIKAVFVSWHKKPAMFICAFALLQVDDPTLISEQLGHDLDTSPFTLALSGAKYFVVIRNPVVNLYERAWCVLELAKAMEFGFLTRDYQAVFVSGPKAFARKKTSCVDAQASNEADLERIRAFILATGVRQIDELILQFQQHVETY